VDVGGGDCRLQKSDCRMKTGLAAAREILRPVGLSMTEPVVGLWSLAEATGSELVSENSLRSCWSRGEVGLLRLRAISLSESRFAQDDK
jgi:hypothetical protein